jgi:hypothetical protein
MVIERVKVANEGRKTSDFVSILIKEEFGILNIA